MLAGKLVLLGLTGSGLNDMRYTALQELVPGIEIQAQVMEALYDVASCSGLGGFCGQSWPQGCCWASTCYGIYRAAIAARRAGSGSSRSARCG
jgi:CHASE2 domain-containing sensor protein